MLVVTIDSGNGPIDYTRYVDTDNPIAIQRSLNTPSTCTLSLNNLDSSFRLPAQRSYLRILSTQYNRTLFTGFLVNDPTYNFLSLHTASFPPLNPPSPTPAQRFRYDLNFTSDEYLLQLKSIAFIPAFVNQTQGQILTSIANALAPGYFDTSLVASGQLVPYMNYDPTVSWSELAKQFADASSYRYSCVDKQIHFQPYGDDDLGIAYDETKGEGTFDPRMLQTQSMTTPIVNDVTVVGSQEAGNNHEDYFMGDGFTGTFPLRHQVFNAGATQSSTGNSGSVVLADPWSETAFNSQLWNVLDPTTAFTLIDNALNVITDLTLQYGQSYVAAYNGLELAGGLIMQHGEFVFNASSTGIVGGAYDDVSLNPDTCETGYQITPTPTVVVTASGASGISIQPFRLGAVPNKAFNVITEINHTYVLTTIVSSPSPVRYTQIYTTLGGSVFGGEQLAADVMGNITWQVQDTNIFTGVINTLTFAVSGVNLPSFAVYALLNNVQLNLSVTATSIYTPPLGTLHINSKIGAGLLVPIYISGNQQYTGAYTVPSGGNLPILPGGLGPDQQWPLGSSLQNQTAELDLGTTVSSLNFYSNNLPGVGTRIRVQTWESQAAVSRITDPASIIAESRVVGDDGHRSAIVTNMNPLPRSSEDCDAAGQAYITDRVGNFYQGSYTASYLFFRQPNTNNIDYYPVAGRYLFVNSPQRGLNKQKLLVSAVTTTIVEMKQEIMNHVISYGPDYHLEKILANFVSQPPNVLLPQDTVIQPLPQQLVQVGSFYLPDVMSSHFTTLAIKGATVELSLDDPMPELGSFYELRSADFNWGQGGNFLLGQFYGNQTITLPRSGFEQLWYLRFIYNAPNGTQAISRRSKVLRLYWPQVPAVPAYLYADSSTINCDFNGDIRNIEGIELRDQSGEIVYYDGIVGSEFDMMLNLDQLRGSVQAGASIIGGPIGSFMKGSIPIGGGLATQTLVPTTITQIPGVHEWQNPQSIIATDSQNDYALATVDVDHQTWTISPLLLEGLQFAIPPEATLVSIRVNTVVGSIGHANGPQIISVQLAASGIPIGPVQTVVNALFPDPVEFGTGASIPSWETLVTAEQLRAGVIGLLVSATVQSGTVDSLIKEIGGVNANALTVTIAYVAGQQRNFNVYFFNLMWEYSPPLAIYIPPPPQAQIFVGYRWGSSLQINVGSITRPDILYTTLQLATASGFLTFSGSTINPVAVSGTFNLAGQEGLFYQAQTNGAPASFHVNIPVTGDIYAQALFTDHIGPGAWSNILFIPRGNLIASDYMSAQGSVPPTITNGDLASGGIFVYNANLIGGQLAIAFGSTSFQVIYPNGKLDTVPALFKAYFNTIDNGGAPVQYSVNYGFFPSIANPTTPFPTMDFNGPYLNYTSSIPALQEQFQDGFVPLTNGPFVVNMPPPGGSSGGGGGGTGGGGNCAASERCIELADGRKIPLYSVLPGMMVKTPSGKGAKILCKELFSDHTMRIRTWSGLETRCGMGHVMKNGTWKTAEELWESYVDLEKLKIWTTWNDSDPITTIWDVGNIAEICRLHLDGEEHVYLVDGIWAHNLIYKGGA